MKRIRYAVLTSLIALAATLPLSGCRSKNIGPYTGSGGQQGGISSGQGGYGGFPEGRITEEMRAGSSGDGWANPDGSGGYGAGGSAYGNGGFGPASEGLDATGGPGVRNGSLHAGSDAARRGQGRSSAGLASIFFDYDSSAIRSDQIPSLERNAAFLRGNGGRILIEGNTDFRGTNEYNLALGERRAASAKNYLTNLGVPESRIRTISYGEENPLYPGENESEHARNRRADFVQE